MREVWAQLLPHLTNVHNISKHRQIDSGGMWPHMPFINAKSNSFWLDCALYTSCINQKQTIFAWFYQLLLFHSATFIFLEHKKDNIPVFIYLHHLYSRQWYQWQILSWQTTTSESAHFRRTVAHASASNDCCKWDKPYLKISSEKEFRRRIGLPDSLGMAVMIF